METTLQDLLDAIATLGPDATSEARAEAVANALAERGADAEAFLNEALERYQDVRTNGEKSEDTVAALVALADVIDGARQRQTQVAEAEQAREDELAALDARVAPADPDGTENEDGGEDADGGENVPDGNADNPGTDSENETAGDGSEVGETDGDGGVPGAADSAPAAVTAAARRRNVRVDLSQVKRTTRPAARKPAGAVITASANIPGYATGQQLTTADLNKAVLARMSRFPTHRIEPGVVMSADIATISIPFEDKALVADGKRDDQDVLDYAGNTRRLKGGSLLAAGDWCAPSETYYELCDGLESSTAGMWDGPEIRVTRGGINTTEGPDIGAVFSSIGFKQTEAQAAAGDVKPNYRVPCPEFSDKRAGVTGVNIIAGILQNDAYPEMTKRVVELAAAVHAHKVNLDSIAGISAGSTDLGTVNAGPSAATSVLNVIEMQIVDYRYRYRANENLQLEVILPIFLKAVIRADLALRNGIQLETVTDQQINGHFNQRGARVQWVYDWQDAFSGVTNGLGSATPIEAWPTSVTAIIYAAGAWVRGRGEIIRVEGVYDSTNLPNNDFTRLFFEEKFLITRRCYQSRKVTIPLAVNGATGAPVELDAAGNVVVPTP
ncbi:MAG TPA: major capsid protein [Pseudonocardia sp.]